MIGAPQPTYAVEGHGLVKTFGDFRAVDGIDVAVPAGSIYGILGPNGAGKTTMLRTLLGIIDPDEGHRSLLGDPCGPPPAERPTLDEAEVRSLIPLVRENVVNGGIRLARLLDDALGPEARAPPQRRN